MDINEIDLVREICHQVDCLITTDTGTMDLEVLERARLKMNDHLYNERWQDAENLAYAILLIISGGDAREYLDDIGL